MMKHSFTPGDVVAVASGIPLVSCKLLLPSDELSRSALEFGSVCRGRKTARERSSSQMALFARALRATGRTLASRTRESSCARVSRFSIFRHGCGARWMAITVHTLSQLGPYTSVPSTRSTCPSFSSPSADCQSICAKENTRRPSSMSLEDSFTNEYYIWRHYVFTLRYNMLPGGNDKIMPYTENKKWLTWVSYS